MTICEMLACCNITEVDQYEEDLRNIQVPENEGGHAVQGLELETYAYVKPLKVHKVNIGTKHNPKLKNIGDYWNDDTVEKITDLV
jgi:hypothetical protein